jgi:hypothetical protein
VEILAKTLYVDKYNFDSLRELCLIPIFHNWTRKGKLFSQINFYIRFHK